MKERLTKKRRREQVLILELQRDHGYMFADLPRERDRYTMTFRGDRVTGKTTITAARKVMVAAPVDSWLGIAFEQICKRKTKRARKRVAP